ncbi:hypothetical protein E2R51_08855 [Jeotgalibacillus sp. S-D1]|uniref:hypothetical protein n=1 Tax=Jeotgalibacillus sp. S-D1 TaxID=2552189 RepID=UPI00105A2EB9|nr:hypothetical protein [Jeotgalibacillus sp. S-D1]TDL32773.1 hypothetical protein E2R51_08855 [Jeotgalibacillus sp. S-D1]
MSKIAIKILSAIKSNDYLILTKKYTGLGLSEIKNRIDHNDLIVEIDANDIEEMEQLKLYIDNVNKLGLDVKILDSDKFGEGDFNYREITYETFTNNIIRIKEIREELQDYDDMISD